MIDSSEVSPQHLQDLGWEMRCRGAIKLAESWPTRFVSSDLPASGGKANSGEERNPTSHSGIESELA